MCKCLMNHRLYVINNDNLYDNLFMTIVSNSVAEFQDLLTNPLDKFLAISNEIGGLVKEQCTLVRKALDAQLDFLRLASQSQKPTDSKLLELLRPTSDLITQIIVRI